MFLSGLKTRKLADIKQEIDSAVRSAGRHRNRLNKEQQKAKKFSWWSDMLQGAFWKWTRRFVSIYSLFTQILTFQSELISRLSIVMLNFLCSESYVSLDDQSPSTF